MSLSRNERAPLVTDAIPPTLRRRGLSARQMFAACLVGALVLAIFASRDTPGWAERLGDAPLDHELRAVSGAWDRAMEELGFTRMHETLRDAMHRALDWQWGD
jgi:hypothetical protein